LIPANAEPLLTQLQEIKSSRETQMHYKLGVAVFRLGLKNGVFTTVAGTR
jgi:hypothetical protein